MRKGLLAVLLLAVAACGAGEPAATGVWQPFPGVFTAPDGATAQAALLFPERGGCFSVAGPVDAGNRRHTGTWVAEGACDRIRRHGPVALPPTSPELDERETVLDTVEGGDRWMTVFAVTSGGRTRGAVLHGTPTHLTRIELRTPLDDRDDVPTAIGMVGGQYAIVGRHGTQPTVYTSAAWSWHDRVLPGGSDAHPLSVAGAPMEHRRQPDRSGGVRPVDGIGPGVIVGRSAGGAVAWSSLDGGATWTVREVPEAAELTDVAYDGEVFVAVGTARDGGAVVLSSPDGATWRVRPVPAGARPMRGVHVLRPPSDPAAPQALGGPPPPPAVYTVGPAGDDGRCATAWRRDGDGWVAEPLGCHGVPASLLQLEDGTIAAVGGTTLWLRRP